MGLTGFTAAKDHIFHHPTPQVTGILLPHYPTDRIDNVTLTTAIWTDNTGNPLFKVKRNFVNERFETKDVKTFDFHTDVRKLPGNIKTSIY